MLAPARRAIVNNMSRLPLKKMSVREKLAAMESIWDDLSRRPQAVDSPAWHGAVLSERGRRVASGKAKFTNWEVAKAKIRKKVS